MRGSTVLEYILSPDSFATLICSNSTQRTFKKTSVYLQKVCATTVGSGALLARVDSEVRYGLLCEVYLPLLRNAVGLEVIFFSLLICPLTLICQEMLGIPQKTYILDRERASQQKWSFHSSVSTRRGGRVVKALDC